MLDGIDAGAERNLVACGRHRVRGDLAPRTMRLIDDRLHLVEREVRQTADRSLRRAVVAAVGVDLDPVRAVRDLVPDRLPASFRSITHLNALRHVQFPRVAGETVRASRRERFGRHEESRSLNDALVDRALEVDIRESRALVADIAQRGEPMISAIRSARVARSARYGIDSFRS